MIKFEDTKVTGWEAAIRGMRNPMNSWDKSDSGVCTGRSERCDSCCLKPDSYAPCYIANKKEVFVVGPNDLDLMKRLCKAGTEHRKFMRMIIVYMDITAPLYWWKEFDTYKVGTVANSCSTMHKIADKEFTLEDFSVEYLESCAREHFIKTITLLNYYRDAYNNYPNMMSSLKATDPHLTKKQVWWQMIQLLPSSYNQKRTVMLNYEVLAAIYRQRKDHKLDEWRKLCSWIETLPYSELITG